MTDWMVVFTTNDQNEAHIVAGRLEVEGVKSFIQRESLGGIIGITYGAMGDVKVVVNPEDYDKAMAILEPDELYSLSDDNEDVIYYDHHTETEDEDDDE
jgi:hypothetical protein